VNSNASNLPSSCELCAAPNSDRLIYDDPIVYVVAHPDRAVAGHVMVVAKRHVENYSDLEAVEAAQFSGVQHRLERGLLAATNADRVIMLKLGLQTPHLHLHLYPVSRGLDRNAVMRAFEARIRWNGSDKEFHDLVGSLRKGMGTPPDAK
jgi:diadenosine tetraphosphate (Ap4A) HIT family hydrolase